MVAQGTELGSHLVEPGRPGRLEIHPAEGPQHDRVEESDHAVVFFFCPRQCSQRRGKGARFPLRTSQEPVHQSVAEGRCHGGSGGIPFVAGPGGTGGQVFFAVPSSPRTLCRHGCSACAEQPGNRRSPLVRLVFARTGKPQDEPAPHHLSVGQDAGREEQQRQNDVHYDRCLVDGTLPARTRHLPRGETIPDTVLIPERSHDGRKNDHEDSHVPRRERHRLCGVRRSQRRYCDGRQCGPSGVPRHTRGHRRSPEDPERSALRDCRMPLLQALVVALGKGAYIGGKVVSFSVHARPQPDPAASLFYVLRTIESGEKACQADRPGSPGKEPLCRRRRGKQDPRERRRQGVPGYVRGWCGGADIQSDRVIR
mmetsp:Transcript_17119/g.35359  ORF Transcript_17119/g.35359 Transcript_17119/m.35359 type:complete len:368 (+) Transcript_17119:360-1463(+)